MKIKKLRDYVYSRMTKYRTFPGAAMMKVWNRYRNFAEKATASPDDGIVRDIKYWRGQLFTTFSIYFVPFSFIALVPGVWMGIKTGFYFVAAFDVLAAVCITLVIFNNKLSLNFRKAFVAGTLYLLALFLIAALGLFGPGIIYLLSITVFLTLISPDGWAYWSVGLHFLTCTCFALIIYFNLFHLLIAKENTLGAWIAFSSNLIFLSLVSIILIEKIINGLESTIINEYELQRSLQKETGEKSVLNEQLLESESHYKSLFVLNPSPMWVFETETLRFIQVNEAAIKNYGYSRDEFLTMTILDIKCDKDNKHMANLVDDIIYSAEPYHFTTEHHGKNQVPFPVEMRCSTIPFKGRNGVLSIARDITEQLNYTSAIEEQNTKLREIAFIQAHVVRAPLARMMGLVDIFIAEKDEDTKIEIAGYFRQSANEIDEIIKAILDKTDTIERT